MSVILTACRKTRERAIEKALKKKAEKKKEKRQAALSDLVDQLALPGDAESVKVWTFLLNGRPVSIVYHLDTLEISTNGEYIDTENEFTDTGSKVSFWLGDHSSLIVTEAGPSRRGLAHTLFIDGNVVPE